MKIVILSFIEDEIAGKIVFIFYKELFLWSENCLFAENKVLGVYGKTKRKHTGANHDNMFARCALCLRGLTDISVLYLPAISCPRIRPFRRPRQTPFHR